MDVEFFPTSLSDMGFEEDLREFMEETEKIYHETGMPMIPCFLHHFCLPFRRSTCPLVFGSWLLDHVIYFKLRKKEMLAKLIQGSMKLHISNCSNLETRKLSYYFGLFAHCVSMLRDVKCKLFFVNMTIRRRINIGRKFPGLCSLEKC